MDSNQKTSTINVDLLNYFNENRELIEKVRGDFLQHYLLEQDNFNEPDIEMVKRDDWWTIRFLRINEQKVDKATKQMVETFRWRKTFGILERGIADLPIEFINGAAIFMLGRDYKCRSVLYLRLKVHRKIPELDLYFRQFMAGILEYVERNAGSRGYVMVYDFSGVGLANFDIDILRFFIQLIQRYYPCGVRLTLMCNMSKICRPLWNTAKLFIGDYARKFLFCTSDQLSRYIPRENIPRYLGGKSCFDFTRNVEGHDISGCRSVNELGPKYGFTQEQIDKFVKIFEPTLREAQLLVKGIPVDNNDKDDDDEDMVEDDTNTRM